MKWLRDEEMAIKTAERRGERRGEKRGREKGIKEGIKEGEKQKAIAIAKNLLDILDNQTISKKTGLT
ncbi:transposase, partial [Candidatus Desantisbacteria bacterium CG_4_9_14_3_um_filter_40_11]